MAQWNVKVRTQNQFQMAVGKLSFQFGQHALRQVDAGHTGDWVALEIVGKFQPGAAPQVQDAGARLRRQAARGKRVKDAGGIDAGQLMRFIPIKRRSKNSPIFSSIVSPPS